MILCWSRPTEHPTAINGDSLEGRWRIHSERNNHSSVMVCDLPNTSQFNPYNITSSLSPWPYSIPLPYGLTLSNPTESWPNCNPIMEIEFWLQIGEISHAEIQRDGPDLTCWRGRTRVPIAQASPSARWRWAHPKPCSQGRQEVTLSCRKAPLYHIATQTVEALAK
jgi:hypothetical protein